MLGTRLLYNRQDQGSAGSPRRSTRVTTIFRMMHANLIII